jgi:hypothetical protein
VTAKSCPDRGTDPVSRGTARAVASTVAASMATSVRWSEEVPETEAPVSYPFRPSGGKFNQSKGPRLYSSVSPTLGEGDTAGDAEPLAFGDATYDSHTPAYNDAMNMSSQISIDMSKHWTRESASKVKRWDNEVGRHPRRASPEKYNPNLRSMRKDVPMGIMPPPGAGEGIDLAGRRLPNRWELEYSPAAAQVPEPEPEPESELPAAPLVDGAASPELQAYLSSKEGSPAAAGAPVPTESGTEPAELQSVSFDPAAIAKAKASLEESVPEPGKRDLAVTLAASASLGGFAVGTKGTVAHGRRRGSPTRQHYASKPGGGGSYGVITGAVHQSRGVQRQTLQEQTGRRPLGNETHYQDRRAAQFGGPTKQGSAWAARTGVDRFGRSKTTKAKVADELLAGPTALSPTRLSPSKRGKAPAPAGRTSAPAKPVISNAVPAVVVHKA